RLAKIDDVDEVYLNGVLIGKSGSFPDDASGYITKWDEEREYHLATNNPSIRWDKENIIAVKVYDGGGPGGIFGGTPYINMMDLIDGIGLNINTTETNEPGKILIPVSVNNKFNKNISGQLKIKIIDTDADKIVHNET